MPKTTYISTIAVCLLIIVLSTSCQEKQPTSALELLNAARLADVRMVDGQDFKVQAAIRLEQENGVEQDGKYELLWHSPSQWREEFSLPDFHQLRIGGPGGVWEEREPRFLSLRVWQLMQAINFFGRFKLQEEESASKINKKNRNGMEVRCVAITRGSGPVREICFHNSLVQLVSEDYLPSNRQYQFSDYRTIRGKVFPGRIGVLDEKSFVVQFSVSEAQETDSASFSLFERSAHAVWRPWCASPDAGGDPLTPIYSLRTKTRGETTLYGALGTDGRWDVTILKSGGHGHDAEVLEAVRKELWKPSSCNGVPIVIETVFKR